MARVTGTQQGAWPNEGTLSGRENAAAPARGIKRLVYNPYLTLISRLVLGGIFLLSGLTKLGVPQAFTASITSYDMNLPSALVQIMAVGLPPLELGLGIWILAGLFTRFAAGISAGLMVVFLIAIIQAWARGIDASCGCFAGASGNPVGLAVVSALGPIGTFLSNEKIGLGTTIRDVVFLLMGVHLVFVPTIFSLDSLRHRGQAQIGEEEEMYDEAPETIE